MRLKQSLTAICLTIAGAGAAAADCAAQLDFLEGVADEAARVSISTSTGGQGVAGAREARALTGEEAPAEPENGQASTDTGPADGETGPMDDMGSEESQAPGHAAPAEAGTRVQVLRAGLEEARALAGQDDAACTDRLRDVMLEVLTREDAPA
ncbi:MAG: hypothetical protein FJX25_04610 [Alphaproteobacteria bacterium]|nr:hypothetical protein [Alphaproteobacteria bacterium]